ncbi:hypothetical protein HOD29_02515 [archaeon]|jgi:hypothetical protein|nr:hypothetical protein [archaeon]
MKEHLKGFFKGGIRLAIFATVVYIVYFLIWGNNKEPRDLYELINPGKLENTLNWLFTSGMIVKILFNAIAIVITSLYWGIHIRIYGHVLKGGYLDCDQEFVASIFYSLSLVIGVIGLIVFSIAIPFNLAIALYAGIYFTTLAVLVLGAVYFFFWFLFHEDLWVWLFRK